MNKSARKILISASALLLLSGIGASSVSKANASKRYYHTKITKSYSNHKYKNMMKYIRWVSKYDYTHRHKWNSWKIHHINKYLTKLNKHQRQRILNSIHKLNKITYKNKKTHQPRRHNRQNLNKLKKHISKKAKKIHKKLLQNAFTKKPKVQQEDPRVKEGLVTKNENSDIQDLLHSNTEMDTDGTSDGSPLVNATILQPHTPENSDSDYIDRQTFANGAIEDTHMYNNSSDSDISYQNFKKYFANDPEGAQKYLGSYSHRQFFNSDFDNYRD